MHASVAGAEESGEPSFGCRSPELICCTLRVIVQQNFQLFRSPADVGNDDVADSPRTQYHLHAQRAPTQLSYTRLLDMFHDLADAFDTRSVDLGPLGEKPSSGLRELPTSTNSAIVWSKRPTIRP